MFGLVRIRSELTRTSIRMTAEELLDLVPRDKFDIARVNAVIRLGYPAVSPILPQLLEWMQDYNWPVAQEIYPFLVSIGEPLAPHVLKVLETDDTVWKEWILMIVGASPSLFAVLKADLERYARFTPKDLDEESLAEAFANLFAQQEKSGS